MTMFSRILVATDGSRHADAALAQAIDLAQSEHSRLTLLTAEFTSPSYIYLAAGGAVPARGADPLTEAQEVLSRALESVPPDLPVTTILSEQPIRVALMNEIKRGSYDLVVIGCRGRGALRSTALGGVSQYMLHHGHVPLLIVQGEAEPAVQMERAGQVEPAPAAVVGSAED